MILMAQHAPADMNRIVVVGHGIAGVTACHALRDAGFTGHLTIVGDESHAPYSRPALSKAALVDGQDLSAHLLPEATHGGLELQGVPARGVDLFERTVTLEDDTEVAFDGLVIATGAGARKLTDSAHELTLRTMNDAENAQSRFVPGQVVVVVGGGALGMELASGAVERGCHVSVVCSGTPMTRHLGEYLASKITDVARGKGVGFIDAAAVSATADEQSTVVELSDGSQITGDVLVTAIGDHAHDRWLEGSGLLNGDRVVTDSRGRVLHEDGTVLPHVVAAGDIAHWEGERQPLWTTAIEHAKVAALSLLRGDLAEPLNFVPYFWTEQFGLTIRVMGQLPVHGTPEVIDTGAPKNAPEVQVVDPHRALLRWASDEGTGTAVAVNYKIPIPKLRRLTERPAAAA